MAIAGVEVPDVVGDAVSLLNPQRSEVEDSTD